MTTKDTTPDSTEETIEINPIFDEPLVDDEDTQIIEPIEPISEPHPTPPNPKDRADSIQPRVMVQVVDTANKLLAGRWGFTQYQLIASRRWVVKFEDGYQPLQGILFAKELTRISLLPPGAR